MIYIEATGFHHEVDLSTLKFEDLLESTFQSCFPTVKVEVKQDESFWQHTASCDTANIDVKGLHHELDLSALKIEDVLESTSDEPFTAVLKIKKNKICLVCQKYFPLHKSRRNHFLKHFLKELVLCDCGKFFTDVSLFLTHYFVHFVKKDKRAKYGKWPTSILTSSAVEAGCNFSRESLDSSRERGYFVTQDPDASSSFTKDDHAQSLGKQKVYVGLSAKKRYECKLCLKQFSGKSSLNSHYKKHPVLKICLMKQVPTISNLFVHSRIRPGEN